MVTDALSKQEVEKLISTKLATSDKPVINAEKPETAKRGRSKKVKDEQ